ncbi:MAG: transposase, partial [Phormidium sp.]
TVSIPVNLPSDRFLPLMSQCAEIFNAHTDWSLANRTYNKNKAHKDLYRSLREQFPYVPSALVQTVRDNALEAIKATKFKRTPRKKPTSGLRYDKRTMTLRGKQLTLSCIGKRRGKKVNKWLGSWPFYQQEQFLTYKSIALGKKVVHVDPSYTSQKCNICKHIKKTTRHKSRFHCKNCGHKTHADLNAARNIRDDYILSSTPGTEEQGSVNNPGVSISFSG